MEGKKEYKNLDSLLALYSAVQNDIAYYRAWEWNITVYYALLSTGIIGIVTNDKIKPRLQDWHLWGLTIIQCLAILLNIVHIYKTHYYLSWNRKLRNRIEQVLGFFEKDVYFQEDSLLPVVFNQRKNYFLFELKEFVFPFIFVLILYEIFAIYIIWNT